MRSRRCGRTMKIATMTPSIIALLMMARCTLSAPSSAMASLWTTMAKKSGVWVLLPLTNTAGMTRKGPPLLARLRMLHTRSRLNARSTKSKMLV